MECFKSRFDPLGFIAIGVVVTVAALTAFQPLSASSPGGETVYLERADYLIQGPDGRITVTGGVRIRQGEQLIDADSVVYSRRKEEIVASGDVVFEGRSGIVYSSTAKFAPESGTGTLSKGRTFSEPWIISADTVERVNDQTFEIKQGKFTTCDRILPHYYFTADKIEVRRNRYLKARRVWMKLWGLPILYLPYFKKKFNDPSRWGFTLGSSTNEGPYLYTTYNYDLDRDNKGTLHFDLRDHGGPGFGVDHRNRFSNGWISMDNYLSGYYVRDNNNPLTEDRFQIIYRNRSQLGRTGKYFFEAEVHKLSDSNFQEDYRLDEFRGERSPRTIFLLARRTQSSTLQVFTQLRLNRFLTPLEIKPVISFNKTPYLLFGSRLIHTFDIELSRQGITGEFSDTNFNQAIFRQTFDLPFKTGIFNWNIKVGNEEKWYSRRFQSDDDTLKRTLRGGVSVSSRFHKRYADNGGRFYQHNVQPLLSFERKEIHSVHQKEIVDQPIIDLEEEIVTFRLNNSVMRKTRGDTPMVRRVLTADIEVPYDLENSEWEPLQFRADWVLASRFIFQADVTYNAEQEFFPQARLELSYNAARWNFSVGSIVRESADGTGNSGQLTSSLATTLGDDWKIKLNNTYNSHTGEAEFYGIRIDKNLHCWNMVVGYDDNLVDDEKRFSIGFYITKFPRFGLTF